jgi:MscS family membrane protein
MTARRIQETLHLRYRDIDRVERIVTDVNHMLSEHPGIEHDFFVFRFDSCGEYALKLFLYAFTVTISYDEYMAVKEEILLKVASIVREHGAELAVPTSTVHMPDGLRFQPEPSSAGPERFIEGVSPQPG